MGIRFLGKGYSRIGKNLMVAAIFTSLLLSFSFNAVAATKASHEAEEQFDISKFIPQKLAKSTIEDEKLKTAVAYGVLETVLRVMADKDSEWADLFKNGKLDIKKIVPILDTDDNLSQVMLGYETGYLIVDADNGNLIQFSYGLLDDEYFAESDAVYVDGIEHFSSNNGVVKDGSKEGKKIEEVKTEAKKLGEIKRESIPNKKWELDMELRDSVLQGYGSNEGTSRNNYITDPVVWLTNYYGSGKGVVLNQQYSLNVPEIDQNSYSGANNCALVATLEIMGYYQYPAITQTQRNTAYTAMKNSSLYSSGSGVLPWDNNNLFKVAVDAVGSPWNVQNSSDDDEATVVQDPYNLLYNKLQTYGPGYISLNQVPYTNHTVTIKGVQDYSVYWWTAQGAYYSYLESFAMINDHWTANTPTTAYLSLAGWGQSTWYYTFINVN
ncbi:hypothetical protein [Cohnella sp. WQ 127256]|uniref:hypothetical protein n=1 Tax=Cohnella sp. WQ 127256 TaxID=2938790 RepID=UPI002119414A|nr:hypothetical protein [Cohnella sp. WQ 127256]